MATPEKYQLEKISRKYERKHLKYQLLKKYVKLLKKQNKKLEKSESILHKMIDEFKYQSNDKSCQSDDNSQKKSDNKKINDKYGFNMNQTGENPNYLIIGEKKCGKSILSTHLINYYIGNNHNVKILIFCTESDILLYSRFFPNAEIYHEYGEAIVLNYMEKYNNENTKRIILFDECFVRASDFQNKLPFFIFYGCEKIIVILTLGESVGLTLDLINNFNHVFLGKNADKNIYRWYEKYFSSHADYNWNIENLEKYQFLVINTEKNKNDPNSLTKYRV